MKYCWMIMLLGWTCGAWAQQYSWEMAGPGGGGRFILPSISDDGKRMMCASDMGAGFYGSPAEGKMNVIPHHEYNFSASYGFFFVPGRAEVIYAAAGLKGLVKSEDGGKTWTLVELPLAREDWNGAWPPPYSGPMTMFFSPERPNQVMMAYYKYGKSGRNPVFASSDGGKSWQLSCQFPADTAKFVAGAFTSSGERYLATADALFRLQDKELKKVWTAPVGAEIVAFSRAGSRYYMALNHPDGAEVMAAEETPEKWHRVMRQGEQARITFFRTCAVSPDTGYFIMAVPGKDVTPDEVSAATVFKTTDGFKTVRPVLFRNRNAKAFNLENPQWTSDAWGWQTAPRGLAVCDGNPDLVMATDQTQLYLSVNGGKSWKALASVSADGGKTTLAAGLPIMSAYAYLIDPRNRNNRYIAMNDFAGWASFDGGRSWAQCNNGNPYPHNVYAAAYDAGHPGVLWAGAGKDHDLPHWKWRNTKQKLTNQGTLLRSADSGRCWTAVTRQSGLPSGNITGIVLDKDSGIMLASILGKGVFRSDDSGKSWYNASTGINKYDLNIFRLKRDASGTVWLVSSVVTPAAVYRSVNLGKSWEKVFSDAKFPYLTGIAFSPTDPSTIYLAAFSSRPFFDTDGGIRRSMDGGKSWQTIFPGRACWNIAVHPTDPKVLFACTYSAGLFMSHDGGEHWQAVTDYPMPSPISITFDPENPDIIYVCNFGGSVYCGKRKR